MVKLLYTDRKRSITGLSRLYVARDVKMSLTFVIYRNIAVMSTWTNANQHIHSVQDTQVGSTL